MQTNPSNSAPSDNWLRLNGVIAKTGMGKSWIYEELKRGFPAPVKLSRRAVCWSESAIDAWMAERTKSGGQS